MIKKTKQKNRLTEEGGVVCLNVQFVLFNDSQVHGDELADEFVDLLGHGRFELTDLGETSVQTVSGAIRNITNN